MGSGKTTQIMRPLSKAALLDTAAHLTAAAVTRGGDRQSYRMVFVSGMPGIIEVQQRIRFVAERCKIPVSHCEIIDPVHTQVLLEVEKNHADRVARVRSELATHLYDVDDRALVVSMQRDMVDTATGHDVWTSSNMAVTATMSRSMFYFVQPTYRHLCDRGLPSIFGLRHPKGMEHDKFNNDASKRCRMFWYSTVPRCVKSPKNEERSCEAFVAEETFICSPDVNSDAMYHETRTKLSGVSEHGIDRGRKPETISWFGSKGFYVRREWWEDITVLLENS